MALTAQDRKWLQETVPGAVLFDEPMASHTTLRVGGPADVLVRPRDMGQLRELVTGAARRHLPLLVAGRGSNLLVRDGGIEGVVIDLSEGFNRIALQGPPGPGEIRRVSALAGARLAALCRFALGCGLAGMEFAVGIPGSVGGAIAMNAGTAAGSMADILEAVTVLTPAGRLRQLAAGALSFGYRCLTLPQEPAAESHGRQTVILAGQFRLHASDPAKLKSRARQLVRARRRQQPLARPSAGSFFKNPPNGKSAGYLIDAAGLKGRRVGDAAVSHRHANFIVNRGRATADDVLALMEQIQRRVYARFGVWLEPEVVIVGRRRPVTS
jgi:UDP-N-acetylmuramate dehydrogenase